MTGTEAYTARTRDRARTSPWWWSLAQNPPCSAWCGCSHDPDEFRVEGLLLCRVGFGAAVWVEQAHAAREDVPFVTDTTSPRIVLEQDPGQEYDPHDAEDLAVRLAGAAAFVRSRADTSARGAHERAREGW